MRDRNIPGCMGLRYPDLWISVKALRYTKVNKIPMYRVAHVILINLFGLATGYLLQRINTSRVSVMAGDPSHERGTNLRAKRLKAELR